MKKIFLAIATFTSVSMFAQIDFSSTRFGILGGYNYSRVQNAHNPSGARHTFQLGGMAMIPIGNHEQFYIQPEVVYYGSGETGKDKKISSSRPGYNALYANDYISVPLLFKAYFSEAESEFFGLLGPRFNFLVNQTVKDYDAVAKPHYAIDAPGEVNGKAHWFNFAISGGVGFSYKRKLEISGRYDVGLSNTYPGLLKETNGADPNSAKKKSQQVASVVLTYIFD